VTRKGTVLAVSISRRKGERKTPVQEAMLLADHGVEGDAHAGTGRQVSLLCESSVCRMREAGYEIGPGDFAENILVDGLEPALFSPGVRVSIADPISGSGALLEVTQIGKECHAGCAIRELTGDCVMPREGVFARVLRGGRVRPGHRVELVQGGPEPQESR
jgi:MOSC domain-containing protein YiiM